MNDINKILQEIRSNYVDELPGRIKELEDIILGFKKSINADDFQTLYRGIHSIKGSGGTHGFQILTGICHQFEDELSDKETSLDSINNTQITNWLTYIDILRNSVENLLDEDFDTTAIDERLANLRNVSNKTKYSCLLVDTNTSSINLVSKILDKHSFNISIMENGYEALGRLLSSKFDLLISSYEIKILNGVGLITAVKSSASPNKNIPSMLITAGKFKKNIRNIDPDYIIQKNRELVTVLETALTEITAHLDSKNKP